VKVSILIVSHLIDIEWLEHCIFSIRKFASGFHEVVLVWPEQEIGALKWSGLDRLVTTRTYNRHSQPLWFLDHEVQKCKADLYCRGADAILHVDSDAILIHPVTPETFVQDGKPELLIRPWESAGNAVCWKPMVDKALKTDSKCETMCWMTQTFLPVTYLKLRNHIEEIHKMEFEKYVLAQYPRHPFGFTEFNTIGNFIINDHPKLYDVRDVSISGWPSIHYIQFWSHGGLDRVIPKEDCMPVTGETPRQVIRRILYES
jgi:hypothetical protein